MKRRDALLGIPAVFGALLLRRKPNPKPIEFAVSGLQPFGGAHFGTMRPTQHSGPVTVFGSGQPHWDLNDPAQRDAFQRFLRFICDNRAIRVEVLNRPGIARA